MSTKGQSALSGLRTIKRDWSEDRISWPATPSTTQSQKPKPGNALSQRMKDIQDALTGAQIPGERTEISTKQIANGSKRPLPPAPDHPPAKKRQLPSSWDDTLSSSSNFKMSRTSSSLSVKSTPLTVASSSSKSSKPTSKLAGVFLSQEQTHILRLVEAGNSIFYTGSAGK